MYSDNEYDYYKVPVSNGTTLLEGTVPYTCEKGKGKLYCCHSSHSFLLFYQRS